MAAAAPLDDAAPHIPVLIRPLIEAVAPVRGVWVDGTLGAGGYTRALLDAGADQVVGIDRDPLALELAGTWGHGYGDRLRLVGAVFSDMAEYVDNVQGVALDLGVSSMQLDMAERGFSFMKDGPLDMRMSQSGSSAADLVNDLDETALADVLFTYGEERASRRIARAIVRERGAARIDTTLHLAGIVESVLPRAKPGQAHPATRSFQALRVAVNDEYAELVRGLEAAEAVLAPGGALAVVTFHSIEDRIVKRYFQDRAGLAGGGSRHAPEQQRAVPRFELKSRKSIAPDAQELAVNPRARSARLRVGWRTDAPATPPGQPISGLPMLKGTH